MEFLEEEIEFYGDPNLEGIIKFNHEMGHIGLNIIETYSVFDMIKQTN